MPGPRDTLCRWLSSGAMLFAFHSAAASGLNVVYRFPGGAGGANPAGPLVADNHGSLYGISDGVAGTGAVAFMLSHGPQGEQETVLHDFGAGFPNPGLTLGPKGELYGSEYRGPDINVVGDVFELTPPAKPGGAWAYHVLFTFPGQDTAGGGQPVNPLVLDKQGHLFGTTYSGGVVHGNLPCNCGLVFELSPPAQPGPWTEMVLHAFGGPPDGGLPSGGLTRRADGTLFGVTGQGGTSKCRTGGGVAVVGCGTVYSLSFAGGAWSEAVLYSFTQTEPSPPTDMLTIKADGALYGDASLDIYRLVPPKAAGGLWHKQTVYEFAGGNAGTAPAGGVVFDRAGALVGTTRAAGPRGRALAFDLVPLAGGGTPWTLKTLFTFPGHTEFQEQPKGTLLAGPNGLFYGAVGAGNGQFGYVFSFKP